MPLLDGQQRAVIANITPQIECGRFPIKRVIGEEVLVQADIFTDGHDKVAGALLFRLEGQSDWQELAMEYLENDRWQAAFPISQLGFYSYTIEAWVDHFKTWQMDIQKKFDAGVESSVDLQIGKQFIEEALKIEDDPLLMEWLKRLNQAATHAEAVEIAVDPKLYSLMRNRYPNRRFVTKLEKSFEVMVDPPKALFSTWYELFPRSCSSIKGKHGTLKECKDLLPSIAEKGFDVLYLPPIHPIGLSKRKGKNNCTQCSPEDPGSPWAIGSKEGGHKAIHPELGSVADLAELAAEAKRYDIDLAMDIALQCSPNHPYLSQHPEWFLYRPDGTIQHAENPPKKYEDIIPFNFETEHWKELWHELKGIFEFWIEQGIRIFRVDNPHTKPFAFWEWLILHLKREHPDLIFLSEAFTRPKVLYRLAKLGFTQSYTYFTWRHTKKELTAYLSEITSQEIREFFRPNFWPNTPDILPDDLQISHYPSFAIRLILAATLSSNYGVYGPAYEGMLSEAVSGKEEYFNSEKYEIKYWDRGAKSQITDLMILINRLRRENAALQKTDNLQFHEIDNEKILYYVKTDPATQNALLIAVNLDPFTAQSGLIQIPKKILGLSDRTYRVHELLTNRFYLWEGTTQKITLDPRIMPAAIFRIQDIRREQNFEYFL